MWTLKEALQTAIAYAIPHDLNISIGIQALHFRPGLSYMEWGNDIADSAPGFVTAAAPGTPTAGTPAPAPAAPPVGPPPPTSTEIATAVATTVTAAMSTAPAPTVTLTAPPSSLAT